eukprot:CAMPEP_0177771926 /NCGR_PEP_ID=MMETSP0491_2-20121128/11907_1 /TAXON_ID=63592 /ORGANISM="Tetraselmis chuii, Strain PLY429" /LENGTH=101 /DNA_ID=CAMNT_0019289617 /DNA_START=473 /DNA_END=775 /DNA_ORIENTATION=-
MSGSEDEFGENVRLEDSQEDFSDMGSPQPHIASRPVQNQPHDEEVAITDDDGSDDDDEDDGGIAGMGAMGRPPNASIDSPPRYGLSDEEGGGYDGGGASLA